MAVEPDNDPEIGSLNAHLNSEPSQAIVITPAQQSIDIKTNVSVVIPHFYGRKIEFPYEFLHEFCKLCSVQKRAPNSTEEDYRLRALPFALKGEANTWLLRLPANSISTWADFRLLFLDYFFPSNKTNTIKKKILACRQDYDESLSQYWSHFKGLLDSCPKNWMCEEKVYNIFYEGANPESKDLLNSSNGGISQRNV
ncbi:activity-regulated cytoskeleton associated protein 2-like [Salvia splendens]|uniref:activity-regulated cytoskeleton associated protein 2-like n=1 Tax=Salvia splendens TaxID=180675 RepID=UPI001C255827|nr:activity-regulated cytoskeleton associated protein 2-like [Salvia splendens]